MFTPLTREQIARRIAQDIPDGAYVNIGIGLPELVANELSRHEPGNAREIILQSENGILGMGPAPVAGAEDMELINAGKKPVTLVQGGAFFHHADSFAMMRGGHIDIAILGAFQVSAGGDLANWTLGKKGVAPAVGGAMDLAVGARRVFVIMEHTSKDGSPKIVDQCTLPLTGIAAVSRIYTDLAVIERTALGMVVTAMVAGLSFDELQAKTGAKLQFPAAPELLN